ncbi:MAG TPA: class I SAM-dependent methyltransferase [Ignavibacteriaceae bacterium]|nr:class I SAM-dependent methyltransferase [Ignavibacteriaceae bacterium]
MDNIEAYNQWSEDYDKTINKTRGLEGMAIRKVLEKIYFKNVLEIGCGTGKNTEWLLSKAERIIGVDFSEKMLEKAEKKIKNNKVKFVQADIRNEWNFGNDFDLITCSLVLEHIQDLNFIFHQANRSLTKGGYFYLGELHPFKQYLGTKARFETENGLLELECFTHNISEFINEADKNDLESVDLQEWFDEDKKSPVPRLLTMVFKKKEL